jgi:hypothetical protein
MKIKHLFFVLSILFFACKKDKDSIHLDTPIPVDTTMRLTKAYFYSSIDTVGAPNNTDSIYYNAKNQIAKIVYKPGSDAVVFSYNDNGDLIKVSNVSDSAAKRQTYYLHYNLNKKVDSLTVTDSSENSPFMFKSDLRYDPAGNLTYIVSELRGDTTESSFSYTSYFRSSKIDSIQSVFWINGGITVNVRHTAIDPSGARGRLNIDKSYLFMMAMRTGKLLFLASTDNVYFQQFLNPDDAVMDNGQIHNSYYGNFAPFTNKFSFNSNGTLRSHQYSKADGVISIKQTYKFEYAKK